jgi:hypothetical protein
VSLGIDIVTKQKDGGWSRKHANRRLVRHEITLILAVGLTAINRHDSRRSNRLKGTTIVRNRLIVVRFERVMICAVMYEAGDVTRRGTAIGFKTCSFACKTDWLHRVERFATECAAFSVPSTVELRPASNCISATIKSGETIRMSYGDFHRMLKCGNSEGHKTDLNQIAGDQCGGSSSTGFTVNVHGKTVVGDLVHELHAALQLIQRRSVKYVGSVELKKSYFLWLPVLTIRHGKEQFVIFVHRHDTSDVLFVNQLIRCGFG